MLANINYGRLEAIVNYVRMCLVLLFLIILVLRWHSIISKIITDVHVADMILKFDVLINFLPFVLFPLMGSEYI